MANSQELVDYSLVRDKHAKAGASLSPVRRLLPGAATLVVVLILGLMIGILPLQQLMLALAGIALVVLVLIRLDLGLWLLAIMVPFASVRPVGVAGFALTATDALVMLVLVAWLAQGIARREIRLDFSGLLIPLGIFFAVLLFSAINAISISASLKELLRWLELIIVYVVVSQHVRRGWQVWTLVGVVFLAASAEALVGYYQFLTGSGPASFALGQFIRAFGTFNQPNPFAGYLGMVLPVALSMALVPILGLGWSKRNAGTEPAESANKDETGPTLLAHCTQLIYPLAWATAAVIGVGMLMSLSRGAWLGAAVAVVVMVVVSSRRGLIAAGVAALILALMLSMGAFDLLPERITSRVTPMIEYFGIFDASKVRADTENWAIVERMARWQSAWGMFEDNPTVGVGIGNYAQAYRQYALPDWPNPLGHAHNIYLNMLAETGIMGAGAYVALIAAWFVYALRVLRRVARQGTRKEYALALGLLGVLVATATHNLFDHLYVHDMNVQIGLTLGLLSVLSLRAGRREENPQKVEVRRYR